MMMAPSAASATVLRPSLHAAMLTGQLTAFSYWLLETFPLLSTIG